MTTLRFYALAFYCILFCKVSLFAQFDMSQLLHQGVGITEGFLVMDYNQDSLNDVFIIRRLVPDAAGVILFTASKQADSIIYIESLLYDEGFVSSLLKVDYDHDGDDDVLMLVGGCDNCPSRYVLLKNDSGTFVQDFVVHSFFDVTSSTFRLHDINDYNLDGKDDYFLYANNKISIYYSDSISGYKQLDLGEIQASNRFHTILDINEDGIPDVFHWDLSGNGQIILFQYLSAGPLAYIKSVADSTYQREREIIAFDDLNGGGTKEVILFDRDLTTGFGGHILTSDNVGGPFSYDTIITVPCFTEMIDLNADGLLDIYCVESRYINNGQGEFLHDSLIIYPFLNRDLQIETDAVNNSTTIYTVYNGFVEITINQDTIKADVLKFNQHVFNFFRHNLIDINNDGFDELFTYGGGNNYAVYFEGLGSGEFGPAKVFPGIMDDGSELLFADFDQDGNQDLVRTLYRGGMIQLSYGDGNGNFINSTNLVENKFAPFAAVGDFEQDGYPDIVLGDDKSRKIYIIRNHAGAFQPWELLIEDRQINYLLSHDYDLDGDDDLLLSSFGQVLVFENDGSGDFAPEIKPGVEFQYLPDNLKIDLDKDGTEEYLDLSDGIIYQFNGTGYEILQMLDVPLLTRVYPFDYNSDGYTDLIVHDYQPRLLYKNTGNGTFVPDGTFIEYFGHLFPSIGILAFLDIDRDGDLDFLANQSDGLRLFRDRQNDFALQGNVFVDENQDEVFNYPDFPLSRIKVDLIKDGSPIRSTFSGQQGVFKIYPDSGSYEIQAVSQNNCWSDSELLPVDFNGMNHEFINLPVDRLQNDVSMLSSQSHAFTRCGNQVTYFVSLINQGCSPVLGSVEYYVDEKIDTILNISMPHSLVNNAIHLDSIYLIPNQTLRFQFDIRVPGVDFISELLRDSLLYFFDTADSSQLNQKHVSDFAASEIRCAYDPNDKLAHPDRSDVYDKSYVIDEPIEYTIRFQNTGNDTAFLVVLRDTLSELLDISTLSPINSSHDYEIILLPEVRILEVRFENILLPDSSANQMGSNGFFTFHIQPISGLNDFTSIYNTAGIYFDANPAILTNTTKLEYISNLNILVSVTDLEETPINIYPNPSSGDLYVESEDEIISISVFDAQGKFQWIGRKDNKVDLANLSDGIYLIRVETKRNVYNKRIVLTK